MKIKKGDKVKILIGKDSGQAGIVEKVSIKERTVLVGGLNVYKKHQKPKGQGQQGGIVSLSRPIGISKVAIICPKCSKISRIGYQVTGTEKIRICKKCKAQI